MKIFKKFIILITAIAMFLTSVYLPLKLSLGNFQNSAYAENTTISALSDFCVLNLPSEKNLGDKLVFADFVENLNVEACVLNPDGSTALNWTKIVDNNLIYKFLNAGKHCILFRLKDGGAEGYYTYSEAYYINVKNTLEEITINGFLPPKAKANTILTVPDYSNYNIKIYDSYGNLVPVNSEGKFTNTKNILGTYYVEYTKEISLNGTIKTVRKTLETEFVEDFTLPIMGINYGTKSADINRTSDLFIFKNYDLGNVSVVTNSDKVIESNIEVAVYNKTKNTYYNFSTKSFDLNTENFVNINTKPKFIEKDFSAFSDAESSGYEYEFIYKAQTAYGIEFVEKLTKFARFNDSAFSIVAVSPVKTYAKIKLVDVSENIDTSVVSEISFPDLKIEVAEGYDSLCYENLISAKKLEIVGNGKEYSSDIGYISGEGIEWDAVNKKYIFHYFKEAYAASTYTAKYIVEYGALSGSTQKTYQFKMINEIENPDTTKPSNIKIGNYDSIVVLYGTSTNIVLPTATAEDFDNSGNKTNGVTWKIEYISGGVNYGVGNLEMGAEILYGITGAFTYRYTATDSSGNQNFKDITFIIMSDEELVKISNNKVSVSFENENKVVFNYLGSVENKIDYIKVVTSSGIFNPQTSYNFGKVESFILETKAEDVVFSAVVVGADKKQFIGFQLKGRSVVDTKPNESARCDVKIEIPTTINLGTIKLSVGQTINYLDSQNIKISGNGEYFVKRINSNSMLIRFDTCGQYIITDLNSEKDLKINVEDLNNYKVETITQPKKVVKKKDACLIEIPYIDNYYGFKNESNISNSNYVLGSLGKEFIPEKTDLYFAKYILKIADGTSFVKEFTISSGSSQAPKLTILELNKKILIEKAGTKFKPSSATAIDKYGQEIDFITITVYDPNGKMILSDDDGFYLLTMSGRYTIMYSVEDKDGAVTTEIVNFIAEYKVEENNNLTIVLIVLSVVAVLTFGVIAGVVIIKNRKKSLKNKTDNTAKSGLSSNNKNNIKIDRYSISPYFETEDYVIKKNGKMWNKCRTIETALKKIRVDSKSRKISIRIYNKAGILIEDIEE